MPNILINPNSGILEFNTGIAGSSVFDTNLSGLRMTYDNFGAINLLSYNTNPSSGVDRFTIDGTNGRLFSVTDNLSGSLFSVNDIAGLPIIEAFDDNTVVMGAFNRNDFVLSGNSLGLGAVPNTGTTKLYVGGNLLVSGNIFISGNQVFTGIGPFATTSNLFVTGSTLDNKINSLSGYVTGITGTFGTLPISLASTGSILDNKINSLSGYVNSQDLIFSGQAFNTGSRLDNKINSLSGYVNSQDIIFSGQIASTGSSLYNSILSLSGLFTGYTGNLDANFASDSQLFATGSILDNKINSLSGYVNSQDTIFSGQTFNTGSRLDNKINVLSGYINSQDIIFSGQAASTGSILDNKINSLSGYVTGITGIFGTLPISLASTGSILDSKINSLSGYVNSQDIIFSGQTFNTGSRLDNKINSLSGWSASALNLASTGSTLDSKINSLSGWSASAINLGSTGSILNTRINNLSGYINSANSNIVFTTGNQNINGNKSFYGDMLLSGGNNRIGSNHYLSTEDGFVFIRRADSNIILLSTEESSLFDNNQVLSVLWDTRQLRDANSHLSIYWNERYLANQNQNPVLTWTGDNIGIGTNTPSEKLQVVGNILGDNLVYNTGNQTINGVKTFTNTGSFNSLEITNKKLSSYNYVNSNFTFGNTYINIVNSSNNITGTLPSGITSGINYYVKNLNTGILLITGSGQRTIDGFYNINVYKNESLQLLGVNNVGYTGWVTLSADNGVS